jgi:hypothetical protein
MRFVRTNERFALWFLTVISSTVASASVSNAESPSEAAQNPALILAHYMPWYEAGADGRRFGWHWTMNAFDPTKRAAGNPEIASHYHPLIGPYDSGDVDVLEYHLLLMKLAGIDGVVADWYGREEYLDYADIHRNTAKLRRQAAAVGLKFAVCYEDQTIPKLVSAGRLKATERVAQARSDLEWLHENWFNGPEYLKRDGKPVLLSFGRDGLNDEEWRQVLADFTGAPLYLSEHQRRTAAAGAFDWPAPQMGLKAQDRFYDDARGWPVGMAAAFPRFQDIYEQAKVHKSWGAIADEGGKTFESTLDRALRSGLPFVQISTWNDWGEGTIIEPSVEFGCRDLETVQRLRKRHVEPSFSHEPDDLQLPHRLFRLRKSLKAASTTARDLDEISRLLANQSTAPARQALDRIEQSANGRK